MGETHLSRRNVQKPSDQRELHLLGGGWRVGCEKGRAMKLEINRSQLIKSLVCHRREGRLGLGLGVNDAQTCQILNVGACVEGKSHTSKHPWLILSGLKEEHCPLRRPSGPAIAPPHFVHRVCSFHPSTLRRGWAVPQQCIVLATGPDP